MLTTKKFFVAAAVIFLMGASFLTGFTFGETKVCETCQPQDIDFSLFWEAYHKIQNKFVDKGKIDNQKIVYGAISGMIKSLEDPYTVFFTPDESKKFTEEIEGATFEGIGMEIGIRKDQLQVISPIEGTPAQKAGFRPGDKILKINDKNTVDLTVDEAVNLIRGQKGTEVTLTVLRKEWDAPKDIKVTRALIQVPSLKLQFIGDNIAYVKLYQFSAKLSSDFNDVADKIIKSKTKEIIVDLRNNPGGLLETSEDIAGWFLDKGQVVVIEDFGNGKKEVRKSKGRGTFSDYHVVVLINGGSASASEILAGALRDDRGTLLIGEKSFGKGSVQQMEDLLGGASVKITIAKWLTPKGNLIADIGLEPDVKVEMTEQDYDADKDPQLDKAIEIIKGMR